MGIKKFFREIKENWGQNKLLIWALGLVGVLLFILPGSCQQQEQPQQPPNSPVVRQDNYQKELQGELEKVLSGIEGAGEVTVMLTLENEEEIIYARNEDVSRRDTQEEDSQGGFREQVEYDESGQLVIVRTNNQEEPVVETIVRPRVRGVLVVAGGADSPWVRESLTHAVQSVLDLPAHRITIQKGQ